MCRRVTCQTCNKPSFAGCGAHVEQVLGDVPEAQRCDCRKRKDKPPEPKDGASRSLWQRLMGR